ncbi:MAG: patatin-like phospholipase family protein [Gemmatimonadales bacterium]
MNGKLGVALSGGGMRAACFHVGVLARLAEVGWLPRVEVLSAVSGGSLVAALWYLDVRRLLEGATDQSLAPEDYARLLDGLDRAFRRAVRRDFRAATFDNPLATLRMAFPGYSRSDRIGDLYDRWLYRPVAGGTSPVALADLKIRPMGHEGPDFHPRRDNADRNAKVPILKLNATNLGSGRAWRFEASRMGEPVVAPPVVAEADCNARHERPASYADLPLHLARFPLGRAVAASSAVPGLFPPIEIRGLYEHPLALVDGGVVDNQGIGGCLDEGCTTIIVSDASGQLDDHVHPATGSLGVLGRAASILADRVREEQVRALADRPDVRLIFVHMRQDLAPTVVRLRHGVPDPTWHPATNRAHPGVDPDIQLALSRVRTDLDAFTELESTSLAALGWTLSGRVIEENAAPYPWDFLRAQRVLVAPRAAERRQLKAARHRMFRLFRMVPGLGLVVASAALLTVGWLAWWLLPDLPYWMSRPISRWSLVVWIALISAAVGPTMVRALGKGGEPRHWVEVLRRVSLQALVAVTVAPVAMVQRRLVRPMVLWLGRLRDDR